MMQFAWNMFQHLWHSQMSSTRLTTSMQMGHRYALGSFFFALSCLDMSLLNSVCCSPLDVVVMSSSSSSLSTFVATIPLVLIVEIAVVGGDVVDFGSFSFCCCCFLDLFFLGYCFGLFSCAILREEEEEEEEGINGALVMENVVVVVVEVGVSVVAVLVDDGVAVAVVVVAACWCGLTMLSFLGCWVIVDVVVPADPPTVVVVEVEEAVGVC